MVSITAYMMLAFYSVAYAVRHGIPEMISAMYYGAQGARWATPLLLVLLGFAMLPASMGKGVDGLAFLACAGVVFVGAAPEYLKEGSRAVHKGGAMVAGACATLWALTSWPWAVVVALALWAAAMAIDTERRGHWLFWTEWAALTAAMVGVLH